MAGWVVAVIVGAVVVCVVVAVALKGHFTATAKTDSSGTEIKVGAGRAVPVRLPNATIKDSAGAKGVLASSTGNAEIERSPSSDGQVVARAGLAEDGGGVDPKG